MLLLLLFTVVLAVSTSFTAFLSALFLLYLQGYIRPNDPASWKGVPEPLLKLSCQLIAFFMPYEMFFDTEVFKQLETALGQRKAKVIFVCNHQLGALEVPVLIASIYLATGIYPRGLADRFHFQVPIHSQMVTLMGGILGDRQLCSKAMEAQEPLLVFPGGSKEVLRSKNTPRYTLQWGDRRGFAKLALLHGYTIIPVSSIGADEQFLTLFDFPISWFYRLIGDKRGKTDSAVLPIFVPKFNFQKQYVRLNKPVLAVHLGDDGKATSDSDKGGFEEAVCSIRDETRDQLLSGLSFLQKVQSEDVDRFLTLKHFCRW